MDDPNIEQKIALLRRRFVIRDSAFVRQWYSERKGEGGYLPVTRGPCPNNPPCYSLNCKHRARKPLTDNDLIEHLAGSETVGVYVLNEEGMVKWLCLDVDGTNEDDTQDVTRALARMMQSMRIPFLVERSGSKGYHLWVFFSEPVKGEKVLAWGKWLRGKITAPHTCEVEVYPKQIAAKRYGNLVKLPLGIHRKTGRRCLFVNGKFEPVEDQWRALARVPLLSAKDLDEFFDEEDIRPAVLTTGNASDVDSLHTWPCFTNLMAQGAQEGARDVAAFYLGSYLRSRGLTMDIAYAAMSAWNEKNDPPINDDHLQSKIESAYSETYSAFPCQQPSFDVFCEASCRFYDNKMKNRKKHHKEKRGG